MTDYGDSREMTESLLNGHSEFAERCRLCEHKFSRTEKQVAEFILENEEDIDGYSIQRLADEAQVGVASIIRFSKTLGYSGFADMKFQMQQGRLVLDSRDLNIQSQDDVNSVKQKILAFAQAILEKCIMSNDNETLDSVAKAILKADTVLFVGAGTSSGVAMGSASVFTSIGVNAQYNPDPLFYRRSAAQLKPHDVLMAFSYSGYSKNVGDAVRYAKQSGASVVLITAFKNTLIGKYADYEIYTIPRNKKNNINTSTTAMAQFALMQILQSIVLQAKEPKIEENHRKAFALGDDMDKYDTTLDAIPTSTVRGTREGLD